MLVRIAQAILAMGALWAGSVQATMLIDPQRPFTVTDCASAMVRLGEAKAGSLLISKQETEAVVELAREQVDQLCGPCLKNGSELATSAAAL